VVQYFNFINSRTNINFFYVRSTWFVFFFFFKLSTNGIHNPENSHNNLIPYIFYLINRKRSAGICKKSLYHPFGLSSTQVNNKEVLGFCEANSIIIPFLNNSRQYGAMANISLAP